MIKACPNPLCPSFGAKEFIKKDGFYYRRSESRLIRRFKCTCCGKKYGKRPNRHLHSLHSLFQLISPTVAPGALIESDEHKRYPEIVARYLPNREYKRYKGGRGCIAGQGELKKLGRDPLFILNHSCAMLRANVNRLIRKTWCTTKRPVRLQMHLEIFIDYYNREYLRHQTPM